METDGRVPERSPKAFISATDSGIRSFAGKESVSMASLSRSDLEEVLSLSH